MNTPRVLAHLPTCGSHGSHTNGSRNSMSGQLACHRSLPLGRCLQVMVDGGNVVRSPCNFLRCGRPSSKHCRSKRHYEHSRKRKCNHRSRFTLLEDLTPKDFATTGSVAGRRTLDPGLTHVTTYSFRRLPIYGLFCPARTVLSFAHLLCRDDLVTLLLLQSCG